LIIEKFERARSIEINVKTFFTKKDANNIGKLRTSCPVTFLRQSLKKSCRKKKKSQKKKTFAKLYSCLNSQSVKTF